MSERARARLGSLARLLCVCVAGAAPAAARSTEAALPPEEILRRADVGALSPESFRARMRLTAGGRPPLEVEVWRKGEARTLVRFLGAKEKGRYLLRLGDALWFLAPDAKRPVRLGPSYRLRGSATLDDVLGVRYARDYRVRASAEGEDGLVVLDLVARAPAALYPAVRYVVARATLRPVRAEYRLPSGKVATIVEFADWSRGPRPYPSRLLLRDALHGGTVTTVDVEEMEERSVPAALFDLADPTERLRLEALGLP